MSQPARLFLLSPANCHGRRAQLLLNDRATFFLARQLRDTGAPLADVFSFVSGLYFRGKIAYARAFTPFDQQDNGIRVITAGQGLRQPTALVGLDDLRQFAKVAIGLDNLEYTQPLARDLQECASTLPPEGKAIFLGSLASDKYVGTLLAAFGERLFFPAAFVGRGDLSRGSLLLAAVDAGVELQYVQVSSASRHD